MTDGAPSRPPTSPGSTAAGGPTVRATDDAAVEPDTKDWTWVLARPCPECGLAAGAVDVASVPATVRALTPRWRAALARPDARTRPAPGVWSTLEYGAHVRDVHRLFVERVRLVLDADAPVFPDWDQDRTAVRERYGSQEPSVVADELAAAAEAIADLVATVPADALERPARRSNGSAFTLRTLVQYYLHDVVHHTHDVRA